MTTRNKGHLLWDANGRYTERRLYHELDLLCINIIGFVNCLVAHISRTYSRLAIPFIFLTVSEVIAEFVPNITQS